MKIIFHYEEDIPDEDIDMVKEAIKDGDWQFLYENYYIEASGDFSIVLEE